MESGTGLLACRLMKRHPETYLNLDGAQMGAGGIDSWSPNAYPMAAEAVKR